MRFKSLITLAGLLMVGGLCSSTGLKEPLTTFNSPKISKAYSGDLKAEIAHLQSESTEITGGHYYDSISPSLTKSGLLNALNKLISKHDNVGYDGLYDTYLKSDVRPDGTIWDFYGDFSYPSSKKAGSYSKEGDCYNREHTVAQSWFGSGTPKSDAFHVVPTDGYINNRRGNYPFGEVGTATYSYTVKNTAVTGISGTNKLGASSYPGYSGKVFEPLDCYKGDFARSFMYFAVCYKAGGTKDANGRVMYSTSESDCYLTDYAKNLLLDWHHRDPVSYKEKARNDAIYEDQNNRNPFIDNPSYADAIWGNGSIDGTKTLQNLTISGNLEKSKYKIGETFSAKGLTFTAHFIDDKNNQTTQDVTNLVKADVTKIDGSKTTVTFSYTYGSITKTASIDFEIVEFVDIEILGELTRSKYSVGEKFDPSGIKVNAIYSDDSRVDVTNKITWSPEYVDDSGVINGTYKEGQLTRTLTITVEIVSLVDVKMSGSLEKTIYAPGEQFDPTGLVFTAQYSDGTARDVTSEMKYDVSILDENTNIVHATYDLNDAHFEFEITGFIMNSIVDVRLDGEPMFTEYTDGDEFDPTGIIVIAIYANGDEYDITNNVTYTPEILSEGDTVVIGHYLDLEFEIPGISVSAATFDRFLDARYDDTLCKTHYVEGEIFDPKGLVVIGILESGNEVNITHGVTWEDEPLEAGETSVFGFYHYRGLDDDIEELELEFPIEVTAKEPEPGDSGDKEEPKDKDDEDDEETPKTGISTGLIIGLVAGGIGIIGIIILVIVLSKKK